MSDNIMIRRAVRQDCPQMLDLIRELAVYERAPDEVTVSEAHFEESGFGEKPVWWAFVACLPPAPSGGGDARGPLPASPDGGGDAGNTDAGNTDAGDTGAGITSRGHGLQMADSAVYSLLKQYVKEMRSEPTIAENELWSCLRGKQLSNYQFRRQHIIGRYIADFICLRKRLIIEVDGLYHQLPDYQEADAVRTEWLEQNGFRVIRFTNEEVLTNISSVEAAIAKEIAALPNIGHPARVPSPSGGGREEAVLGFALYYIRYSTWKGQRMYLEDILVTESARGQGIGSRLMEALIEEAKEKKLHGISWQVLHWNEPAVRFYERYNARFDPEWVNVAIDV